MDDTAHGEAQEAVDLAHPLGVALGQIVVDRDDVDALAGERVEVRGEGGHQRLALAGLHLGDPALMEDHAAQQLHVEVAHAHGPHGGLPDHGEGLGQDVVQGLAFGDSLLKEDGLLPQLLVRHGLVSGLQGVDLRHHRTHLLQLGFAGVAQQFIDKSHYNLRCILFQYASVPQKSAPVKGGKMLLTKGSHGRHVHSFSRRITSRIFSRWASDRKGERDL